MGCDAQEITAAGLENSAWHIPNQLAALGMMTSQSFDDLQSKRRLRAGYLNRMVVVCRRPHAERDGLDTRTGGNKRYHKPCRKLFIDVAPKGEPVGLLSAEVEHLPKGPVQDLDCDNARRNPNRQFADWSGIFKLQEIRRWLWWNYVRGPPHEPQPLGHRSSKARRQERLDQISNLPSAVIVNARKAATCQYGTNYVR